MTDTPSPRHFGTSSSPNLGKFGSFGRGVSPEQAGHRGPRLRSHLGGRFPAGRAVVGRSHPRADQHAEAGHRDRQHLDRAAGPGRRVVPPHREGLPGPLPARHRRRPSRGASGVPQAGRRAHRLSRQTRRVRRAQGQPGGGRAGPEGAEAVGGALGGRAPVSHDARTHRRGAQADRPSAFLAPEHKVVLTTDAEKARAVGRKALEIYLNLANYLNSWKRLGLHRR